MRTDAIGEMENLTIGDKIRESWDLLWKKEEIRFCPEENMEKRFRLPYADLKLMYIPERAKRIVDPAQGCPLERAGRWRLLTFGDNTLIANYKPITRYHCLLMSNQHIAQNAYGHAHLLEATRTIEQTGQRGFLNLVGTAATVDHFHVQTFLDRFSIETMRIGLVAGHYFLKDYYGANMLFRGEASQRASYAWQAIQAITHSDLPKTIKSDGTLAESPLYTALFWEDNILVVPRRRERPESIGAMTGGLELSGTFVMTDKQDFLKHDYPDLEAALREVMYPIDSQERLVRRLSR